MTVRNIRAYQARGLLPPPLVDGRVGYYTKVHRDRLTMIRRLRAEGFNLVAISALLTGVVPVTTVEGGREEGTSLRPITDLSEAGGALLALGVPIDAVIALHNEVSGVADAVAAAYGRVFDEHVRQPWVAAGSPESRRYRVTEAANAFPSIASAAVTATLTTALRSALASSTPDRPISDSDAAAEPYPTAQG
jgi:DNA-binding transcriptional MerR regulator